MTDLADVVSVLKSINEELSWWKDKSTASVLLKELEKVNDNLDDIDRRLRSIESKLD